MAQPVETTHSPSVRHHITKPEDKVPTGTKIGYGLGMSAQRVQVNGINQLANPIFNDILGIDPRLIGLSLGLTRIFDAITDPIVGFLSDKTRSRFGRRRPWIAASSLLCAVSFAAVWMFPRGMSDTANLTWFIVTSIFAFISISIFSIPYMALGMELTPDYHERTSVMAYRSVMAKAGGFLVSSLFLIITLDCFDDIAEGMRYTGMGLGVMIIIFTMVPVICSREHPSLRELNRKRPATTGFFKSLRLTFGNRPFLVLIFLTSIMLFGLTMVNHLSYYLIIYHIFDGERSQTAGLLLTSCGYASQFGGLLGIPVMAAASKRIGKRSTLLAALAIAFVGDILKWFCFTPDYPYLALIPNFLLAFALGAVWTLVASMVPDTVDFDEWKTGQRREGMFSAIQSWTTKVGMSLALIISGFVLTASGFDSELGPGQAPETITTIRIFYCFIPAIAMAAGFILMWRYPLTEKHAYAIRSRLEKRRQRSDLNEVSG